MLKGAPSSDTNRPLPGWITPDVIERTRATWEPLYGHALTADAVIDLLLNVGNLFRLLRDSTSAQARTKTTRTSHGDPTWSIAEKNPSP